MDVTSTLGDYEADADHAAQVAALEKEMEEITGEVPDNGNGHRHGHDQEGQGQGQGQDEDQILGDLDVDNDNQGPVTITLGSHQEDDGTGQGQGHSSHSLQKDRVFSKFVLEGENENDGIVYYVVENDQEDGDGDGVYSIQNHENQTTGDTDDLQSHEQIQVHEADTEECEDQDMEELGVNTQEQDELHEGAAVVDFPVTSTNNIRLESGETMDDGEGNLNASYFAAEMTQAVQQQQAAVAAAAATTTATTASTVRLRSLPKIKSVTSTEIPDKIPKLEPGLADEVKSNLLSEESASASVASVSAKIEAIDTSKEIEPLWEENACIVCNCRMAIDDPENLIPSNTDLKNFFAKMLGLGDGLQLEQETTYPFCETCTDEVTSLKSIANKIDYLHKQFDRMRDTLAMKTVKTFLQRKEPELMQKEEEQRLNKANHDTDKRITIKDIIYNRWKTRYDLNFPGPKCPLIIKTMDSKGRTTMVRMTQHDSKDALKNIPVAARYTSRSVKEVRRVPVLKIEDSQEATGSETNASHSDYKCKDCDKGFSTSNMLAYHSRIHSGELPFECELCGKGFAVPHYLMIHMRSHTGEKPYKCEVCGKGFAQRGGLVTHNLVHSGDKPFECTECGKSFRQKYHLTQHLLIHSGAKPFGCDICGKFFNVKMNLREHMRRHTGDRPYKCPYCVIIGFFRKKMLRDHIVKAHPSKQLPGELENLTESKPTIVRRPSGEISQDSPDAKRMKRKVQVKTESSSEVEIDDDEDYPSPTPSPVPQEQDASAPSPMKRIPEDEEFNNQDMSADNDDPIAILAN